MENETLGWFDVLNKNSEENLKEIQKWRDEIGTPNELVIGEDGIHVGIWKIPENPDYVLVAKIGMKGPIYDTKAFFKLDFIEACYKTLKGIKE